MYLLFADNGDAFTYRSLIMMTLLLGLATHGFVAFREFRSQTCTLMKIARKTQPLNAEFQYPGWWISCPNNECGTHRTQSHQNHAHVRPMHACLKIMQGNHMRSVLFMLAESDVRSESHHWLNQNPTRPTAERRGIHCTFGQYCMHRKTLCN